MASSDGNSKRGALGVSFQGVTRQEKEQSLDTCALACLKKKKEKQTLNLLPCYFMIKFLVSDIFTFTAYKYSARFFVFIYILQVILHEHMYIR